MGIDSRTRFTLPIKYLRFDWVQKSIPETIHEFLGVSLSSRETEQQLERVLVSPKALPAMSKDKREELLLKLQK